MTLKQKKYNIKIKLFNIIMSKLDKYKEPLEGFSSTRKKEVDETSHTRIRYTK